MIETVAVYLIVAAAAVQTVWRVFLRGWVKRHARVGSRYGCELDCACDGG